MVKRNVIFLSVLVLTTMLVGIGVSYSLWNISISQDTTNIAEAKCFDLSITNKENNISLNNAYPISNDKGKSLTPYTFTVTNTCDITAQYNINLEVLNNSTLSSKFVDVMLENNDIKEINLLSNFNNADKVNTSSIESRKLTTGILKSQESKDYSLRLWIDYNTTLEDLNNEIKTFKSKIIVVGKPINFNYDGDMVFNYDYTGAEQTFTAPVSGTYKLETWGAQGGNAQKYTGGYGGYSIGVVNLVKSNVYYINIGGKGQTSKNLISDIAIGGYNGGGNGTNKNPDCYNHISGSGGGATHVANTSGLLFKLENNKNDILIVSSGGGGASYCNDANYGNGGSGGGYKGSNANDIGRDGPIHGYGLGSSQTSAGCTFNKDYFCGSFGVGYNTDNTSYGSGGGSGLYGGGSSNINAAGGGSGYIGNPLLTNKVMYCYNCEESSEESTKTISTTCSEETPTSYCAKKGNGYARITLVSIDE